MFWEKIWILSKLQKVCWVQKRLVRWQCQGCTSLQLANKWNISLRPRGYPVPLEFSKLNPTLPPTLLSTHLFKPALRSLRVSESVRIQRAVTGGHSICQPIILFSSHHALKETAGLHSCNNIRNITNCSLISQCQVVAVSKTCYHKKTQKYWTLDQD